MAREMECIRQASIDGSPYQVQTESFHTEYPTRSLENLSGSNLELSLKTYSAQMHWPKTDRCSLRSSTPKSSLISLVNKRRSKRKSRHSGASLHPRTNAAGTYTCVIVHREVSHNVKVDSRQFLGLDSNQADASSEIGTKIPAKRLKSLTSIGFS